MVVVAGKKGRENGVYEPEFPPPLPPASFCVLAILLSIGGVRVVGGYSFYIMVVELDAAAAAFGVVVVGRHPASLATYSRGKYGGFLTYHKSTPNKDISSFNLTKT